MIIRSDHGNVEALSTRNHTRNPVPVLCFGAPAQSLKAVRTLADVGALALRLLGLEADL